MGAPQFEDGEMCWHESGDDVPWWFLIGWILLVVAVVFGAAALIVGL